MYFEKFFYGYAPNFSLSKKKHEFINTIVKKKAKSPPPEHQYIKTLCEQLGGVSLEFSTTTSLVIGMGQGHPLENGMLFHPTWGCPYIPGSSIKGALRAYFDNYLEDEQKEAIIQRIFGSDDVNAPAVGKYQFFDALPTKEVSLCTEEMTPHYGDWYSQGGDIDEKKELVEQYKKIPGDWHEPKPIHFLSIKAGNTFQFAIAPSGSSNPDKQTQKADLKLLEQALENQLEHFGLGAKTATGFGYFCLANNSEGENYNIYDQKEKEKQEKEKREVAAKEQEIRDKEQQKQQLENKKQQQINNLLEWQKELITKELAEIDDQLEFHIKNPNQLLKSIEEHSEIKTQIIDYLQLMMKDANFLHKYSKLVRKGVKKRLKNT